MSDSVLTGLYEQLMGVHRAAFDGAYYSAAYHALAGALHCAGDAGDVERVSQVEHLATEQLAWIDANVPAYEHSSQSAETRGHVSIYTMLARQAHAKVLILQHQQKSPAH